MRRVAALLTAVLALQAAQSTPPKLQVMVLEGDRAVNNIRQRTAREPVVEIRDENGRPVEGATVTFILPESGPSGIFPNGSHIVSTVSDEKGQAAGLGLRPNQVAGDFQIRVTASYQGRTGSASITQTNAGKPPSAISGKLVTILALAGGAAAAGVLVSRSDSASAGNGKAGRPSIIPGTPEVGGPR